MAALIAYLESCTETKSENERDRGPGGLRSSLIEELEQSSCECTYYCTEVQERLDVANLGSETSGYGDAEDDTADQW